MTPQQTGRTIGGLILLQLLAGIAINFVLTAPLFAEGGFLLNAADNASRIGLSALLAIVLGVVSLFVAALLYRLLRSRAPVLALTLLMISASSVAAGVLEQVSVLAMLSYSEVYQQAAAEQQAIMLLMKNTVANLRNWAHYCTLIVSGLGILTMYLALLRSALVPKALAVFGVLAALAQISGVSMPLFGSAVNFAFLAPLALSQLLLASFLLWKGVAEADD